MQDHPSNSEIKNFQNGNKCECNCHGREEHRILWILLPILIEMYFLETEQQDITNIKRDALFKSIITTNQCSNFVNRIN